ncbi:hypothetical protein AXYL_00369 [Achromobacter xylosoxidans A8]|uniref:Uncharacterized protein n=1 Tax=Achromobacter xylosoxidans (strain A8) TaxID=762376 RepID=E3HTA2_ACHXA|nr:hypothetical protein AXYL_00369 [Achromobacter xylosoxidans A8]
MSIQRRAIRVTENQNFIRHVVVKHCLLLTLTFNRTLPHFLLHGVLLHQTSSLCFFAPIRTGASRCP